MSSDCWSYCIPDREVGYRSLNLISKAALFLPVRIVSVASDSTAPWSVAPYFTLPPSVVKFAPLDVGNLSWPAAK